MTISFQVLTGQWTKNMHDPTPVPVAACPSCGHHALQSCEVRTIEAGAELYLTCRSCGGEAVLTIT